MRLGTNGANQIKQHSFFQDINWDAMYARQVQAQFIPEISSDLDVRNIDRMFTKE